MPGSGLRRGANLAPSRIIGHLHPVDLWNLLKKESMHRLDGFPGDEAPSDVGLVRRNDEDEAGGLERPAGLGRPLVEAELVQPFGRIGLAVAHELHV